MAPRKAMYTINGVERLVVNDPDDKLSDFLRKLGLTSVKVGCGVGQCGSCTVLLDGKPVRSCTKKMKNVPEFSKIETVESLGTATSLHPLQLSFIIYNGVQCGFCTPGFLMSAKGLLDNNITPTRQQVRDWFTEHKNVCRCTGYKPIVDAVMAAAKIMRGEMTMKQLEALAPPADKVFGNKYPRPYALGRVLGVTDYGDDIALKMPEGTLELALVQATCAHGNIKGIDFSEAEKMPGVVKVITAKDVKGDNNIGMPAFHARNTAGFPVRPVIADKKVYRLGDCVALVAADTREHARAAAKKVKVDYEPLPHLTSLLEAVLPDAVRVHEESGNTYVLAPLMKGEDTRPIIEKAPFFVEGSFYSSREPHLAIEPHSVQAYVDDEGVLTIQWKAQSLHSPIASICKSLGVAQEKLRIICNPGGGSFGMSMSADVPALVGAATLALGRPVTLTMSYAEHQKFTGKRSPSFTNSRMACDKDGKILAIEFDTACEHGAYQETGGPLEDKVIRFPGYGLSIPNIRGLARAVYSNNSYGIAYRAFGSPQAYTASEQLIDMLAKKAGFDPFELRYINAARPGDTTNNGYPYHVYPVVEMFDRLRPYYKESLEWKKQPPSSPKKKRGIGVALGGYHVSMHADTCEVWLGLNPDNTVTDYNCWQELGQGTDTGSIAFTQKALEPLKLRADQIKLVKDDTGVAPRHGASAGSRSNYASGNAHIVAANLMLDAMRKDDGTYRTYDEMIADGKPVLFKGVWTEATTRVPNSPNDGVGDPMLDHNHIVSVCRLEVDVETGKVDVIAIHSVADVGVISNKAGLDGQAYGGAEHSLGFALSEEYSDFEKKYETMYGCGTTQCNQMPDDVEFEYIETPRKYGPFGSTGAAECFQSSPHTCILNAIADAIDCRIYEIPANPEKIKAALAAKAEGKELKPDKYFLGSDLFETLEEIEANPLEPRMTTVGAH